MWDNYDYSPLKLIQLSLTNAIGMDSENIGIVLLLLTFMSVCFGRKMSINMKKIYVTSVLLLLFVTNIFPWMLLQHTPLKVIQFPWRFLSIGIVLLSVCAVVTLNNMHF